MRKKARFVPNIVTAFGLSCGLFIIFKVNLLAVGTGPYEVLHMAALLLLVAAFADFSDGALARAIRAESEFGFVFDSLSDAITFGVAPSVVLLKTLSISPGTLLSFFSASSAMVFSLCAVLRLVRFSVKATEAKGNVEAMAAQKKFFTGLPVPASALALVSIDFFSVSPWGRAIFPYEEEVRAIVLASIAIVLGYLMVSRLKFPSLKTLHLRGSSFYLAFFAVLAIVFVLYGILYFFALILALLLWLYVLTSLVLSFARMVMGKRLHTLEDFDPEEEDEE